MKYFIIDPWNEFEEENKMATEYQFTEEDLNELIGDDLSLPASLLALINDGGDIRSFLVKKLEKREQELAVFHLSQSGAYSDSEDWNSIQDAVDAGEARYMNAQCFG